MTATRAAGAARATTARPMRCALVALALAGASVVVADAGAASAGTVPFEVIRVSPAGGSASASGAAPIVVTFSKRLAPTSPAPSVKPRIPGSWRVAANTFVFTPRTAFVPEQTVHLEIPAGARGVRDLDGQPLRHALSSSYVVRDGSVRRLQELLATLDYLPVRFVPRDRAPLGRRGIARAAFAAVAGRFVWRWNAPRELRALFVPGEMSLLEKSALVRLQSAYHLPETGAPSATIWRLLARDALDPAAYQDPGGYTYALASQQLPETLTVYDNGRVVLRSLANTGIPESPTASGTFAVYLRLATQVMTGVDPWGQPYADPVAFVAYFNGSDAVHYIARADYGYPQSLGCVELPYAAAQSAYPYLTIGTLVTVRS